MAQVTSKPREIDPKISEEKRIKESPGIGTAPKPELQTVRFEWPGLQVGPGSDILFYKPNQRRPGELPQGIQPVPAIWLPSPHGAPWQYSGLADNNLANGHPASPPSLGWYGAKHIVACGGIIILLLMLLSYLDRYRILALFRPRRSQGQKTVKVICHLRDKQAMSKLASNASGTFTIRHDKPSSYSNNPDQAADAPVKEEKPNEFILPYSCIFTSGKGKVPRVLFVDARKDQKELEKLGLNINGPPLATQQMNINVPTQVDANDPKKETANLVIEINDPETESGCVIGMGVLVNRDGDNALVVGKREGVPFSIRVEKLDGSDEPKETEKTEGDAEI